MHKYAYALWAAAPLMLAITSASLGASQDHAAYKTDSAPLLLTITNGPTNYLAVINSRTRAVDYVPTGGVGGASGNAGGVAVEGRLAAAVNFGSSNVTTFIRRGDTMQPVETIKTASKPVSVAFGHNHLVVLGLTTLESFPVFGESIASSPDGAVQLAKADQSAAQVVSFNGGFAYTEKSGSIAWVSMSANSIGAGVSGPNLTVQLPDTPNNDTPFGLIGRGANLYVTIAHSGLEVLVVNSRIVSSAAGPVPYKNSSGAFLHAPCWNTLSGQFLYSADSPGKQLLRYLVSDTNIFFDKPSAATLSGPPTDLAADGGLLGVIDGGDGSTSNASLFDIDSEGELTLRFAVKIGAPINGAAIIR